MAVLGKAGVEVSTCLMGLPINQLWRSVQQELKRCFSNLPTAAHTTMTLNTIMQKPSESQHIKMFLGIAENTDPMRIYHFVAGINNANIADKIAK